MPKIKNFTFQPIWTPEPFQDSEGRTNPGHQLARGTKFCKAIAKICGSSSWYPLFVTLLTLAISGDPNFFISGGNKCTLTLVNHEGRLREAALSDAGRTLTCGILKRRSRFATWMDVTLDAAPTTPEITLRTWVLLQWYSAPSILLIEPETRKDKVNEISFSETEIRRHTPSPLTHCRIHGGSSVEGLQQHFEWRLPHFG